MADVLAFRPKARPVSYRTPPLSPGAQRKMIEEAAQAALDVAERLVSLLDTLDGSPDDEDGGDPEPSLGTPEGHASQVVWLPGGDRDLELGHERRGEA